MIIINELAARLYRLNGFEPVDGSKNHRFDISKNPREQLMYQMAKESFDFIMYEQIHFSSVKKISLVV